MRADAGGVERAPLATGPQHEEDGVHRPTVWDTRVMAAEGMGLPGWEQRLETFPQLVGQSPTVIVHAGRGLRRVRMSMWHGYTPCNVVRSHFYGDCTHILPTGIGSKSKSADVVGQRSTWPCPTQGAAAQPDLAHHRRAPRRRPGHGQNHLGQWAFLGGPRHSTGPAPTPGHRLCHYGRAHPRAMGSGRHRCPDR
jgi:hypothetical protein